MKLFLSVLVATLALVAAQVSVSEDPCDQCVETVQSAVAYTFTALNHGLFTAKMFCGSVEDEAKRNTCIKRVDDVSKQLGLLEKRFGNPRALCKEYDLCVSKPKMFGRALAAAYKFDWALFGAKTQSVLNFASFAARPVIETIKDEDFICDYCVEVVEDIGAEWNNGTAKKEALAKSIEYCNTEFTGEWAELCVEFVEEAFFVFDIYEKDVLSDPNQACVDFGMCVNKGFRYRRLSAKLPGNETPCQVCIEGAKQIFANLHDKELLAKEWKHWIQPCDLEVTAEDKKKCIKHMAQLFDEAVKAATEFWSHPKEACEQLGFCGSQKFINLIKN